MQNEPRWLPTDVVVHFNESLVQDTQEPHYVRDLGALESALDKAKNRHAYGERDVIRLAVAIAAGIVQNHPFEQGNKRTALTCAVVFLRQNGWELDAEHNEALALVIERLAAGRATETDLEQSLCVCAREIA